MTLRFEAPDGREHVRPRRDLGMTARHRPCSTRAMSLSHVNLWIAHALGTTFLLAIVALGVGILLFGAVSVVRQRHA